MGRQNQPLNTNSRSVLDMGIVDSLEKVSTTTPLLDHSSISLTNISPQRYLRTYELDLIKLVACPILSSPFGFYNYLPGFTICRKYPSFRRTSKLLLEGVSAI